MRKYKTIAAALLVAVGTLSFGSPAYAKCSTENPCHTYAVVDDTGNVSNIIVCQEAVCGGGSFNGMTVVPQIAAAPGGASRGGMMNSKYDHEAKEFILDSGKILSEPVFEKVEVPYASPDPVIELQPEEPNNGTDVKVLPEKIELVVEAEVSQSLSTFKFEDTVDTPLEGIDYGTPNVPATISANLKDSNSETINSESITFESRSTKEKVVNAVSSKGYSMILGNIQAFFGMNWFSRWLL